MREVAIVGGGPGGLITAYLLERKSDQKPNITIFEATDRVGGKVVTKRFQTAPVPYEAGVAELYDYSHLGPDPLRRLVKRLGLKTIPMAGQAVVMGNRLMRHLADVRRHLGKKAVKAITSFRKSGGALVSPQQYYDSGWPDDNDHVLINRPFDAVLAKVRDRDARRYLRVAVHSDLAVEPHLTNALYGVENSLMDVPGYIRLYSIRGGLACLPQALRANLSARVELGVPVRGVRKTHGGRYRVLYGDSGQTVARDFDAVILALPHSWLPAIEWGGRRLESAMLRHHKHYDRPAHYLRVCILFREPFWRRRLSGSYFHFDAFGGCCVYDEGTRFDTGPYGVLSWLLAGNDALVLSNCENDVLIGKVLETLPRPLASGRQLFLEGRVHRWVGTVNGQPAGYPVKGAKARHRPEPEDHPGLFVVGDYLFDSTINGVTDSADIATDLLNKYLNKVK
jgi:hypothetical protein